MMIDSKSKVAAILAHITIFGWIGALVMNSTRRSEFTSFYIRQTLLLNVVLSIGLAGFFGRIIAVFALVFLILSLIGVLQDERRELPFVGANFQDWFKGL